ncbi:AbrB/MazE/SpoVT family DNA-binding domain-containing protein [Pseudomonas asiatica]|uniref:AbrB/MazE/SpoVT family DNA-binding domain-containing protein n=1 Tax=Pseudomonas asiatica TaxID=2219225 RepID=UPI001E3CFC5A|nr:AbrB/MazE/SpoVT family DNA-binding domain-containing protein [Pseudomonas asiatica]MCE1097551.1 AbrB/MazE/SpoVT family DNA-binding domain-containing protein [Pseudomonas asiatica]MCE1102912.1 AbrB/MazE/SpoVT family DNA-binding domain-containing protein [Pseudomonas asiatica]
MNQAPGPERKRWIVTCQEAADGTGDLIVPLPADLLKEMGLSTGDTLYVTEVNAALDKRIILSKKTETPDS